MSTAHDYFALADIADGSPFAGNYFTRRHYNDQSDGSYYTVQMILICGNLESNYNSLHSDILSCLTF